MTTAPAPQSSAPAVRTRWAPVVAVALAMLVATSEMSMAGVVLPSIGADLGADPAATTWVLLAYALPMAAIAIPAGRWADRADPRLILAVSMAGVGVTSVLAALAPALWVLLAVRLLQGVAGGLTLAVYLPVIAATVRADQRARVIGAVVTIMTVGGMAGTSSGGLVAGAVGWRAVFLLKLPLVAVALWLGLRALPRDGRGLPAPGLPLLREAVLLGGTVAAVLVAVDEITARPVLAAGLGALSVGLGLTWARLPASRPVVALVRARRFGFTTLGLFLVCFNVAVTVFLLPYFVADVLHEGPEVAGMLLLVQIGAMTVTSPVAGWLADRVGALPTAATGAGLTAGATLLPVTLSADAGLVHLGWQVALIGVGFGLFNTPVIAAVMATAPTGSTGAAGGVGGTVRMIATTLAPAVAALCWTVAGGGLAGFRTALVVLTAIQAAGVLALLAARGRRTAPGPARADD
ncbi:MFS transporter [Micromonospora sp. AMSO12t]|uniref:MFS transporter n=1 Tax=unclassified Micromonospora TaxID=2617518 RepID=UPI00124B31F0|nr:MFS transporter [Micromonospora sp. AMSO12t]KAB1158807.1 MFS transporter [Micromonospora sp. AMSO12t]